jgi:hypothetical protein
MFEDRFTTPAESATLTRRDGHVLAQLHACPLKHERALSARTKGDVVATGYIILIVVAVVAVIAGVIYFVKKK